MKKGIVAMVMLLMLVGISAAVAAENIPIPQDPKCKENEQAMCTQSCNANLVLCSPMGTFQDGKFVEIPPRVCNPTTCVWNCVCVVVAK